MLSVKGTYKNGVVSLDEPLAIDGVNSVIVTFLEDEDDSPKRLTKEDFSFSQSRNSSKRYRGSLSEAVLEERASER